jgi:integrase
MQGSVTKVIGKNGVSWAGVTDLPRDPLTGRRRQKRVTATTKRECEEKLRALLDQADVGEVVTNEKLTVTGFAAQWLEAVEPSLRPSTFRRYADMLRVHILPQLGKRPLALLTPFDLQRFYANRLAYGLSSTSVHHLHVMLHRVLKQAERWGMVTRNVSSLVDAPRRTFPEITTWNLEQVNHFFTIADQHDLAALWRLALLTGMRRGELLGLKWEDIDLDRGVLAVRRTMSRGKGGQWELGQPKTASGRRSIALPASCVTVLRKQRANQNVQRLRLGELWQDCGFVFTNRTGESLHVNSLGAAFKAVTATSGLPVIRFHDLRHTSATLLLAQGVHPKIVQERLGHADISMTLNRYSHVTPDMQRSAADMLDATFSNVS